MRIKLSENFRALFYAPFYATAALGFYAREGVEVDLVASSAPGEALARLGDGGIDLLWGGPMRVMKAHNEDPASPLVCFGEVVARDPFYLVGRRGRDPFQLADIPNLRFASVSEVPTPWLCLQHDMRQQGIDPSTIARAPSRTMGENLAALGAGELDVVQLFEPYVSLALKLGAGEILYAASARGPTVYTTFIAARDVVARQRPAFAAMTRAVRQMQDWLSGHGGEELAAAAAPYFPEISHDIMVAALQRYHDAGIWARDPAVSRQGFACLAASLQSGGFISRVPAYEDCVAQISG